MQPDRALSAWATPVVAAEPGEQPRAPPSVFRGMRHPRRCMVTPDGRFVVAGDGACQVHVLEILL
jgi:hypothetical protein